MKVASIREAITALTAARNLVTHGHTQLAHARDTADHPVEYWSENAVRFCASGALLRVSCGNDFSDCRQYLRDAMGESIIGSNDRFSTTPEQVTTAFDFAILFAKDDLKRLLRPKKKE